MIVAGIDEAGYGPLLGPLVVSGVVFSVPDRLAEANLWDVLTRCIAPTASKGEHRLPIADSKRLFNRKAGLLLLERTALLMRALDRKICSGLHGRVREVRCEVEVRPPCLIHIRPGSIVIVTDEVDDLLEPACQPFIGRVGEEHGVVPLC